MSAVARIAPGQRGRRWDRRPTAASVTATSLRPWRSSADGPPRSSPTSAAAECGRSSSSWAERVTECRSKPRRRRRRTSIEPVLVIAPWREYSPDWFRDGGNPSQAERAGRSRSATAAMRPATRAFRSRCRGGWWNGELRLCAERAERTVLDRDAALGELHGVLVGGGDPARRPGPRASDHRSKVRMCPTREPSKYQLTKYVPRTRFGRLRTHRTMASDTPLRARAFRASGPRHRPAQLAVAAREHGAVIGSSQAASGSGGTGQAGRRRMSLPACSGGCRRNAPAGAAEYARRLAGTSRPRSWARSR